MATYPPPQAPQPPPPPQRPNQAVLAVVIGIVVVVCLFLGFGFFVVRSLVLNTHISETGAGDQHKVEIHSPLGDLKVNGKGDNAKVDIHSPFGDLRVNPTPNVAGLDIEIYPGASLVASRANSPFRDDGGARLAGIDGIKGVDFDAGDSPGAQVQLRHGTAALEVNVAEFHTSASPDQVLEYYATQLGRYGSVVRRQRGRAISLQVKLSDTNVRAAAVAPGADGTHFILVRVQSDAAANK
ncbi:MAG: hypothetical protein ACRD1E_02935 [Terriglobales bacterium]